MRASPVISFVPTSSRSNMRYRTAIRYACYLFAVLLVLCSLWCLLWVVSSWSMAFSDCGGALFSENPRCRQPSIAGLLALACMLGAIAAVILGGKRFRS